MLFQAALPKLPGPVRAAFGALIERIRQTIETTEVYNTNPGAGIQRGTIVSYYLDPTKIVRPTSDTLPVCQGQYAGVLTTDLPAAPVGGQTSAVVRHDGGPQYVRMDTGLTDIHVGDSVWAAGGLAEGLGRLSAGVSPTPIYVGMIEDLYNYDDTAAPGDTGVLVVLKHAQPVIA
jgi:hypothetical protein